MSQIMFVFLLVVANTPLLVNARKSKLRIMHGVTDIKGKYPYVVALVTKKLYRMCTGTLITPVWVLTAAHCLDEQITHIQYGNMSVIPITSESLSTVVEKIQHPGYRKRVLANDIGMCRVTPVPLETFGNISAVDYTSLVGKVVEYAGYGLTHYRNKLKDLFNRPLQLGEGVVIACCKMFASLGPNICVAPKCSNKRADAAIGDSGGPLFCDGKLVGVVSWGDNVTPIGRYAAISPFHTWILGVIRPDSDRRTLKRRRN